MNCRYRAVSNIGWFMYGSPSWYNACVVDTLIRKVWKANKEKDSE